MTTTTKNAQSAQTKTTAKEVEAAKKLKDLKVANEKIAKAAETKAIVQKVVEKGVKDAAKVETVKYGVIDMARVERQIKRLNDIDRRIAEMEKYAAKRIGEMKSEKFILQGTIQNYVAMVTTISAKMAELVGGVKEEEVKK